jgi:cobalt-zinc-cadmium efflux system outer membrane protein
MQQPIHCGLRLPILLAVCFVVGGCALPSSKENVKATAELVAVQTSISIDWRRGAQQDAQARTAIETLLKGGITLPGSVAIAFLASPELQLALEDLEIARSDLVKASTLPNPLGFVGTRAAGGAFAAYYPGNTTSVGVMMNVMALLTMPDRRVIATHALERQRFVAADQILSLGARVTEAWLDYAAARRIQALREDSASAASATLDLITQQAADGERFSVVDVAVERNGLFSIRAAAIRASLDAASARVKLGQLLGLVGWHDDWTLGADLPPLPGGDPDLAALETSSMQRRFDILAASKVVDARLRELAMTRRFRWLNGLEGGVFRDRGVGGTTFTGPSAVVELPLFDQRQAELLAGDAQLRAALRRLELARLTARTEIRLHGEEMRTTRQLLEQYQQSIVPNQQLIAAQLGESTDAVQPDHLRLRLDALSNEEAQVGLLRDYWRARSALAIAAGQWNDQSGLPSTP